MKFDLDYQAFVDWLNTWMVNGTKHKWIFANQNTGNWLIFDWIYPKQKQPGFWNWTKNGSNEMQILTPFGLVKIGVAPSLPDGFLLALDEKDPVKGWNIALLQIQPSVTTLA